MEFCPKCGSVLVSKKEKEKTFLACRRCGYKLTHYKPLEVSESVEPTPLDSVVIVKENKEILPKAKEICPKCGNQEALWWMQQTRSSDEAPTLFFKCTKCRYSWREY
jgi:DNA-directed RNA polymerase subunit M